MNPANENTLCEKYPKIFRDKNAPLTKSLMAFGLECGDGWFDLINHLCFSIQAHIDFSAEANVKNTQYNQMITNAKNNQWELFDEYYKNSSESTIKFQKERIATEKLRVVPDIVEQVVAVQIKEKFGTLRFYYNGGDDVVDGMVRLAESLSSTICEECGNKGRTVGKRWLTTLCRTHEEIKSITE